MRHQKTTWNTYYVCGYTHDVGNDQRSAGGVHIHQIRKTKTGWEKRIVQSNGGFLSVGDTESLSDTEGLSKFKDAKALISFKEMC